MPDEEINLEEQESDETEDRITLGDVIFVRSGLPELHAMRAMRGHIVEEMLSALLRAGLMTKEQLADALARGEKSLQKSYQSLIAIDAGKTPGDATEAAEQMVKAAATVSKHFRDKFIDEKPEEPEA